MLTWHPGGIEYEPDPRHSQILIRELGLENSGGQLTTPGVKERPDAVDENDTEIAVQDRTWYRSLCMRLAYLSQDRPDLGVVTRELAKGMSAPTTRHVAMLKHAVRYLKGRPRLVQVFKNQQRASYLCGWCDANHAGCIRTRKSTSGGCLMIGAHCIVFYCRGQSVIALSSGEAEYYSLVTLMLSLIHI